MAMLKEAQAYQMLLRGHAPTFEPFRRWVTGLVLPSVLKSGSYDIGASKTPEAIQPSMDYGDLRALIDLTLTVLNEICGIRKGLALRNSRRSVLIPMPLLD